MTACVGHRPEKSGSAPSLAKTAGNKHDGFCGKNVMTEISKSPLCFSQTANFIISKKPELFYHTEFLAKSAHISTHGMSQPKGLESLNGHRHRGWPGKLLAS